MTVDSATETERIGLTEPSNRSIVSVTVVPIDFQIYREHDGQKIPVQGLFSDFLKEKARSYVEPTRVGTPKGEPVGLSRHKYTATLLALTSFDLKKAAKGIHVSYGLLRKWRTEAPFKKLVKQHRKEFTVRFAQHIKDRVAADHEVTNNLLKLPPSILAKTQVVGLTKYDEFNDGDLYGDDLFFGLVIHCFKGKPKKIESPDDLCLQSETLSVFDYISVKKGRSPSSFRDRMREHKTFMLKTLVQKGIELLTLSKPTVQQRRLAIFHLTLLAQLLEAEEKMEEKQKDRPSKDLK